MEIRVLLRSPPRRRRRPAARGRTARAGQRAGLLVAGLALSACADTDTGRNAMPGTVALTADRDCLDLDDPAVLARLQVATGYGQTTLQKAARVLAGRGWIVLIRAGKNWLTIDERKELWRAGSAARQRRNVWACTIPTTCAAPACSAPYAGRPALPGTCRASVRIAPCG